MLNTHLATSHPTGQPQLTPPLHAEEHKRIKRHQEMPKQHINQSHADYEKELNQWAPRGSQLAKKTPPTATEVFTEVVIGIASSGPGANVRGQKTLSRSISSFFNLFRPKPTSTPDVAIPTKNAGGAAINPAALAETVRLEPIGSARNANQPGGASSAATEQGRLFKMSGNMKDLKQVNGELYTFQDMYKGQPRLNIAVHGRDLNPIQRFLNKPSSMVLGNKDHTPAELLSMLTAKGIDPKTYPNTRLIMCFSGNGGSNSFAAKFQELTGKPVKAYVGSVTGNFEPEGMSGLFSDASANKQTQQLQDLFAKSHASRVEKGPEHNYQPIHFDFGSPHVITV